ncbi:asparagine synthetase B family protein, partial [Candidatus Margulisiibacteriota bacterium]
PLLSSSKMPKRINRKALYSLLKFGAVSQPLTILEDVFCLLPGHYMYVEPQGKHSIEKYYDLAEETTKHNISSLGDEELIALTRKQLEEAAKYHLVADVEVGAFLSGGVDSTAIVSMMSELVSKPIKTFSVGFEGKAEVEDELPIAREVSKYLGTDHQEVRITNELVGSIFDSFISAIDQPSIDGINTYIVSKFTSQNVKVALSGLGGDEIFMGYPHFRDILLGVKKRKNIVSNAGKFLDSLRPNRFTAKYRFLGLEPETAICQTREIISQVKLNTLLSSTCDRDLVPCRSGLSLTSRMSLMEIENYLRNTLLRDSDAVSMAFSLEIRPILLDHKLVEFVLALPDRMKIKGNSLKYVFIQAVKDRIPQICWDRKKTGFEMPFVSWMSDVLYDRLNSYVHSENAKQLFSEQYHVHLLENIKNKKIKREYWLYLILLAWLEEYNIPVVF